jgi:hypothetical protein
MKRFLVCLVLIGFVGLCLLGPSQDAQAQGSNVTTLGGPGSKVSMKSDSNLLFSNGGGHIEWTISGPVVKQMRDLMDISPRDWTVSAQEADKYITDLDHWIESHNIHYHGAKILRCSLLNHQITTDTRGLIAQVNATEDIGINFIYDAAPDGDNGEYQLHLR